MGALWEMGITISLRENPKGINKVSIHLSVWLSACPSGHPSVCLLLSNLIYPKQVDLSDIAFPSTNVSFWNTA